MSWLVQTLLKSRPYLLESHDLESDEYNNLLIIEKKVETLYKAGILSEFDLKVLGLVSSGKSIHEIEKELDLNRVTISKLFINLCGRIAYFIGGVFTDEGFIAQVAKNNNLTNDQVKTVRNYISSKFKHKTIRKPIKNE
jgi:hypothetical protein